MKILVSPRVAEEYGDRIRAIDAGATLIVPAIDGDALRWSAEPAAAEVCCLSVDMWEDEAQRRLLLPAIFRIEGLRWMHSFSAGVDAPVFQVLIDRGTVLTNSTGASAPSIAQYVLAMMLHRAKPIDAWREQQARAEWRQLPGGELTGQACGIIGTGAIGGEVARLAKAFGMTVLGLRRSAKRARHIDEQFTRDGLHAMLARSDFVVLACPLTGETEGMIGETELRAMKPAATLVNVARGRVVREDALVRALREGWIAGAVLDVFEREPLPEDSELWRLPNVIVTPHSSGSSPLNMQRSMAIFLENLERFVNRRSLRNRVLKPGAG